MSHDPNVAEHFTALVKLFEARSTAISEGMARKSAENAAKKVEKSGDGTPADA